MDADLKKFLEERFDTVMEAHQKTREEVQMVKETQDILVVGQRENRQSIRALWNAVGLSEPPPPGAKAPVNVNLLKKDEEILDKVTSSDLDMEALKGTVIAVDSKVGELTKVIQEVKDQNSRQLQALGTEQKGFLALIQWMIKEKDGQKFFFSAFAAVTGLVTALGTTYALMTGRLPMPNAPLPTPSHVETSSSP